MADEEYKVGKGRPPLHTRFQPGQSGNPKGRPKGARNVRTEVQEELLRPVTIKENGRSVTVSTLRAIIKAVVASAAAGNVRAATFLVDTGLKLDGLQKPEEETDAADDQAILAAYRQRLKGGDHE